MLPRTGTLSAASVAEIERRAIALDLGAPVSIRINPRARRLLLRIDTASRQVELVLPKGVPVEHGLKFLDAQRGWIAARLVALPMPSAVCRRARSCRDLRGAASHLPDKGPGRAAGRDPRGRDRVRGDPSISRAG